tara:strand:+ start:4118 stop:4516 length:399 start_codon:yes stop_codon:yes gene_type:complete
MPAGFLSTLIILNFPERGYLSSEFYIGRVFELQLLVCFSFLLSIPLCFIESKRFEISFKDMISGSLICTFLCILISYGYGIFPLMLIFYLQWLWICYFWQKKYIPAFRYSVWLLLGLICGTIAGSVIAYSVL